MTTLVVAEAANQNTPPRPLRGTPTYTSRPFYVDNATEVLWKLDRFNPLSSLSAR